MAEQEMTVEVKGSNLVITLPLETKNPKLSKSQKSLTVATTSGIITTDVKVKGKPLKLGVNAFIAVD